MSKIRTNIDFCSIDLHMRCSKHCRFENVLMGKIRKKEKNWKTYAAGLLNCNLSGTACREIYQIARKSVPRRRLHNRTMQFLLDFQHNNPDHKAVKIVREEIYSVICDVEQDSECFCRMRADGRVVSNSDFMASWRIREKIAAILAWDEPLGDIIDNALAVMFQSFDDWDTCFHCADELLRVSPTKTLSIFRLEKIIECRSTYEDAGRAYVYKDIYSSHPGLVSYYGVQKVAHKKIKEILQEKVNLAIRIMRAPKDIGHVLEKYM